MSVKIMGMVWEKDLPFNKAWVLMAMADHADHDGKNVFPSLPLIAWKTGYSIPSVKRIVAELRDDGILRPYGYTQGGVVIYAIEIDRVPDKRAYSPEVGRPKGRIEKTPRKTPYQIDTPFCDTHNHQFSINKRECEGIRGIQLPSRNSTYTTGRNPIDQLPDFSNWDFAEDFDIDPCEGDDS